MISPNFGMSIGIIGSGRVGSNLAFRLGRSGWHIKGIFDIDEKNARNAARFVPTGVYPDIEMMARRCHTIIVSTPDSEMLSIADQIAEVPRPRTKCILHTSGVLPSRILRAAGAEFWVGSMHPAKPIPKLDLNQNPFDKTTWSIEGDFASVVMSKKIIDSIGGKTINIDPDKKAIYHAACALLSNHLFSILNLGDQLLEIAGLDLQKRRQTIANLSGKAVEGFTLNGMDALTGALKRGDIQTVLEHIAALESLEDHRFAELYKNTIVSLPNYEKVKQSNDKDQNRKRVSID